MGGGRMSLPAHVLFLICSTVSVKPQRCSPSPPFGRLACGLTSRFNEVIVSRRYRRCRYLTNHSSANVSCTAIRKLVTETCSVLSD